MKLITWERKIFQSKPKVSAVSLTMSPMVPAARMKFISLGKKADAFRRGRLLNQEQGVEHDRLRERDGQNRLHQDRCGCAGIAADGGRRAHADKSDADGRAKCCETHVKASGQFR